jgi:hypothetical protein
VPACFAYSSKTVSSPRSASRNAFEYDIWERKLAKQHIESKCGSIIAIYERHTFKSLLSFADRLDDRFELLSVDCQELGPKEKDSIYDRMDKIKRE